MDEVVSLLEDLLTIVSQDSPSKTEPTVEIPDATKGEKRDLFDFEEDTSDFDLAKLNYELKRKRARREQQSHEQKASLIRFKSDSQLLLHRQSRNQRQPLLARPSLFATSTGNTKSVGYVFNADLIAAANRLPKVAGRVSHLIHL